MNQEQTTAGEVVLKSIWMRASLTTEGRVVCQGAGVAIVGSPSVQGQPALVLLYDAGQAGFSPEEYSISEHLLDYADKFWVAGFPTRGALVVQRDARGGFDICYPRWGDNGSELDWHPLRWPGAEERSLDAFLGLWGRKGHHALAMARRTVEVKGQPPGLPPGRG